MRELPVQGLADNSVNLTVPIHACPFRLKPLALPFPGTHIKPPHGLVGGGLRMLLPRSFTHPSALIQRTRYSGPKALPPEPCGVAVGRGFPIREQNSGGRTLTSCPGRVVNETWFSCPGKKLWPAIGS